MGRKNKKSQDEKNTNKIILATAIINLVIAIINLIKDMIK